MKGSFRVVIYLVQWYMCSELRLIQDHQVLQPFAQQDHVPCWASTKFESEDVDAIGGVFLAQ